MAAAPSKFDIEGKCRTAPFLSAAPASSAKIVQKNKEFYQEAASTLTRTRVLLLTDSFLPHAGGSREYYHNIYLELVGLGDSEVEVLTKTIPGWQEFDRKAALKFYTIRRRFKPLSSWKYSQLPKGIPSFLLTLWSVLRKRPSIIHAGDLYPPGVIAMTLKKLFRIPYVVYCHGEEIPQLDKYRFQPRIRNKIYINADAVIAASEFTRQNLLLLGIPAGRICKITPGVNANRFRASVPTEDLKRRYHLEGKTVLLTVSRLVPRKGHRIVLKAFAKLAGEIPSAHYLIAGVGPEEQSLRQLAHELGLADRVTFAGYVPDNELGNLYSLCDIMVMPNRQEDDGDVEGFGIVFLEANSAGKPVIGGRTGGAVEAIAHGTTGYLVNPDDADELAGIMRRLLLDRELREKLGEAGAHRVSSDFNWKARAELLRSVNRRILSSRDTNRRTR